VEVLVSFLDMGGYGGYVWPAFGATALVLIGLLLASVRSLRAKEAALAALRRKGAAYARRDIGEA
jgi:heme exporter protein D